MDPLDELIAGAARLPRRAGKEVDAPLPVGVADAREPGADWFPPGPGTRRCTW